MAVDGPASKEKQNVQGGEAGNGKGGGGELSLASRDPRSKSHAEILDEQIQKMERDAKKQTNNGSPARKFVKNYWKYFLTWIIPFALLPLLIWGFNQSKEGIKNKNQTQAGYGSICAAGYTLLVMVIFWITEALPLSITALIPIFFYPFFGVLASDKLVQNYFSNEVLIFVGGINLALAFEFSNLHKRVALKIILIIGTSPKRLLLGIVITTAFLSMWMSNTAVTALMVPIVLAVTDELDKCMHNTLTKEFEDEDAALEAGEASGSKADNKDSQASKSPEPSLRQTPSISNINITAGSTFNSRTEVRSPQGSNASFPKSGINSALGSTTGIASNTIIQSKTKVSPAAENIPPPARDEQPGKVASANGSRRTSGGSRQSVSTLSDLDAQRFGRHMSMLSYISNLKSMFLLSIAYSSNIGGTGVITGSGTNIASLGHLGEKQLPPRIHGNRAQLTFVSWIQFNFFPMIVNLLIAYWFLIFWFMWFQRRNSTKVPSKVGASNTSGSKIQLKAPAPKKHGKKIQEFKVTKEISEEIKTTLKKSYSKMGSMSCHEIGVFIVFILAVALWIFHDPKEFDGWSSLFDKTFRGEKKAYVELTTTAIVVNLLLFIIPRRKNFYKALCKCNFTDTKYDTLLEWDYVHRKFPWGVILLLGGGFAMSQGVKESKLGDQIGQWLQGLSDLNPRLLLFIIVIFIAFFTEVASNTAVAQIFVPVLRDLSCSNCWHPLYLPLPAAVASSYAFMLPVATPPNAIVFQAGNMKISEMVKPGFIMNLATTMILYLFTLSWGEYTFDFAGYCTAERAEKLANQTVETKCK